MARVTEIFGISRKIRPLLTGRAAWTILRQSMAFLADQVSIYGSLADPPGSSVVVGAVAWIEGTLLGTVATTVAVIAVGSIGFMMLAGRVNVRHGLTVIVGSFILFGASAIAAGIRSSLPDAGQATVSYVSQPVLPATAAAPPPPPPIANDDPYAGASVARP